MRRAVGRSLRGRRVLTFVPIGVLSLATLGIAASVGLPDGCNTISNVGILSDHLDPASPDSVDATWGAPALVMRDNPWLGGSFDAMAGVQGVLAQYDTYRANGTWVSMLGRTKLTEYDAMGTFEELQYLPLLPKEAFQGPGIGTWQVRSGSLVHGNIYKATMEIWQGPSNTKTQSTKSLHLALSEKVALVPIVLVTWRWSQDPQADFTNTGKAMIDFVPYLSPRYMASELSIANLNNPNKLSPLTRPDAAERPPDDIFAKCNVQFQVIGAIVANLPAGYIGGCDAGGLSTMFKGKGDIETMLRNTGGFWPKIVDELKPIYVAYGDRKWPNCSFVGKTTGSSTSQGSLVEVDYKSAKDNTTAHELGHVLLGSKHEDVLSNNLMKTNNGAYFELDPVTQCPYAWEIAKVYSDRFRAFNVATGRVWAPMQANPIGGATPTVTDPNALVCCRTKSIISVYSSPLTSAYKYNYVTNASCDSANGVPVAYSSCEVCCESGGNVSVVLNSTCSADHLQSKPQCDLICCSNSGPDFKKTRYACTSQGGTEIECTFEQPQ